MRITRSGSNPGSGPGTEIASKPPPASSRPARVSTSSEITFPTEKTVPISSVERASIFLYGEKKAGKTSFASKFSKPLFLAFEKGYTGLSLFVVDMFDESFNLDWKKFVKYVNKLVKEDSDFDTVIIDTVDGAYSACMAYVCSINGWEHPSDVAYGKAWAAVSKEFQEVIGKLIACKKFGVMFISHAAEKEFLERTGGKYDKIIPSVSDAARKYIAGQCDLIVFYGYHGNERLLTIAGSDSLESGNRLKYQFWIAGGLEKSAELLAKRTELYSKPSNAATLKEFEALSEQLGKLRVHSIPAGNSEDETYENFVRAFNNKQETTGEPVYIYASIEKKAPMKSK